MDLSPTFNDVLARHDVSPISPPIFDIQRLDDFLKEAYRIRSHIASLNTYLRRTRQSYLSTDRPSRAHLARTSSNSSASTTHASLPRHDTSKYLTDAQRTEIDASTKLLLRELNAAINSLSDAEAVRQQTQTTLALKKRARTGLGAVGRWASGGTITAKSPAEIELEEREKGVQMVREGVLWYLTRQLEECGRFQGEMMEIRLRREVEKSKSALYKAQKSVRVAEMNGLGGNRGAGAYNGGQMDETKEVAEQRLDPEQLQLFAQENQDMLKHYEDSLDQVRHAERSLLEISELQSTIANNLTIQSEHIDQLIDNTYITAENVGGGNKELKRATERKSTARILFYGTSVFCLTLVVWDLLI